MTKLIIYSDKFGYELKIQANNADSFSSLIIIPLPSWDFNYRLKTNFYVERYIKIIDSLEGIFNNKINKDIEIFYDGGYLGIYYIHKTNSFYLLSDDCFSSNKNGDIEIEKNGDVIEKISKKEIRKIVVTLNKVLKIIDEIKANPDKLKSYMFE